LEKLRIPSLTRNALFFQKRGLAGFFRYKWLPFIREFSEGAGYGATFSLRKR
jgi:hypothetical protein